MGAGRQMIVVGNGATADLFANSAAAERRDEPGNSETAAASRATPSCASACPGNSWATRSSRGQHADGQSQARQTVQRGQKRKLFQQHSSSVDSEREEMAANRASGRSDCGEKGSLPAWWAPNTGSTGCLPQAWAPNTTQGRAGGSVV